MAANGDDELLIPDVLNDENLNDWWDDLSDEAKKSIERGLKDAEEGKLTPHKDVMKKHLTIISS